MEVLRTVVLVVVCLGCVAAQVADRSSNSTQLTDLQVLDRLLQNYDRRATPTNNRGVPTTVICDIYLRSFGSINPTTMDYQVDLYLQQTWHDDRLRSNSFSEPLDLNDPILVKKIWKPEVFFANAKHAEFQFVTVPNVLIRIKPEGQILYMLRLKLTFACMMDLFKYPLDEQVCGMEIGSFSKTTSELVLRWRDEQPVKLYRGLRLPQFQITNTNVSTCREDFTLGEYSCLVAEFYLKRSLGYHLVQSYLPTILVVVISWVSFWLDVEAIPARVTLGVTTLLTISHKASAVQAGLPQVSYVKAMDVWMGACITFVFSALLEFTLVNYLWRKTNPPLPHSYNGLPALAQLNNHHKLPSAEQIKKSPVEASITPIEGIGPVTVQVAVTKPLNLPTKRRSQDWAKNIDQGCRVLFPGLFVLFNIFYWPYYMWYSYFIGT